MVDVLNSEVGTNLREIDTAVELITAIGATSAAHCVGGIIDACSRPLVYSRHHWLVYKGEYRVRADLRSALESIRARSPREWDTDEAGLVLTLLALDLSSVGLDELVERADPEAVRAVLHERHSLYRSAVDPAEEPPRGLLDLALRVGEMRAQVQVTHESYSIIDGRAWYRTEGLIPREEIDARVLAGPVASALGLNPSAANNPSAGEYLRTATIAAVQSGKDGAGIVRAIMGAALADPVLRADHVTVTCPMGDLLETPHEMTTSGAFFTETRLRDGLDLGDYADRLGHESSEQLQRTIRARMLKLKRGAIRSLYGPGCLNGRFVEKHGGHMLFRNEDAHYRGHQSIGCSSGGRASFRLRYRSGDTERSLTPMVGDFRVVRMSHDEAETFGAAELRHVIRYGEWIRAVVEQTYRMGVTVQAVAEGA
jgi:hypothetical protein